MDELKNCFVSVEAERYEYLVKCKARLEILTDYVMATDYVSYGDLCMLLGIKDDRKERDHND